MRTKTVLKQALFSKWGRVDSIVKLPHTWNAFDGQDGGNNYFRGKGVYKMELPNPTKGKKQFVEFQGANHIATVYCNGEKVGVHKGGFSTFRFEVTQFMESRENTLMVEVDNGVSEIYPQSADFTFCGGLYREVSFIETDLSHFDLLKHGSDGVFITPYNTGTTRVDLFPIETMDCEILVTLKDREGNVAAKKKVEATTHTVVKLKVSNPHLWQSITDPYLYTCEAVLLKGEEKLDEIKTEYGYRSFHVDPERGFFLNGKSYPLHGVSRHQDKYEKGWAISRDDHETDAALIKEIGANTVRLAHYQHAGYFYDICDREGFVVWAEIPFISQFMDSKEAYENTISQMTELIAQNYNHPSICFWGIANEITIGGESENLYRNLMDLQALCKKMDPFRLTTMAQVSMVPMDSEHIHITDVLSYNHYFGWYVGEVTDNGPWLDAFHALHPDRALGVSEYGAENIIRWHSACPQNHDYTEEYASYYHHEMLKTFEKRPYLWSTHVWNMFDFAADARDEGGEQGRNNKGLVTYDREIKKDAFYIYKAYWTKEPFVHVAGRRFEDRAEGERDIRVYTNCKEVTLYVNGNKIATKEAMDHMVVFEEICLQDGENTITAECGDVKDTIVLNGVKEHQYAYDLPEGNEGANWFHDPAAIEARKAYQLKYKEGYYSLKDKVGVLMKNPETAGVLKEIMSRALEKSPMAKSFLSPGGNMGKEMQEFMALMPLANLFQMAGAAFTREEKYAWNECLNQIKKGEN